MNNRKIFSVSMTVLVVSVLISAFTIQETWAAKAPSKVFRPTHISIPTAKVDARVVDIGVTPEGNLDVPNNYTDTGWYKYGTVPGNRGSAVIDGHVDNGKKTPGPFKYLKNAKLGDDIYITMSDGSVLHYEIILTEVYDTDKFPGEKVFHENDNAYLKIITCHGTYVPRKKTYDQRLIVTAKLIL